MVLRAPVTAPDSIKSMMPSVTISVCTPRSFFAFKKPEQCLRNAADAKLDRAAILDQPGDVFGDLASGVGDLGAAHFGNGALSVGTSTSMS